MSKWRTTDRTLTKKQPKSVHLKDHAVANGFIVHKPIQPSSRWQERAGIQINIGCGDHGLVSESHRKVSWGLSFILFSLRRRAIRCIVFVLYVLVAVQVSGQTDRAHLLAKRANTVHRNTCDGIDSAATCHHTFAEGCSGPKGTYDAYLSFLKNTTPSLRVVSNRNAGTFTSLQDFQDLDNKAASLSGDEGPNAVALAELGQGNFYTVIGYLYYAIPGGKEACNCRLTKTQDKDFHIGIGFDAGRAARIANGEEKARSVQNARKTPAEQTSIIVEMTPHYRTKFHPTWDLPSLENQIGQQVKITGQLLFDSEHAVIAQDCALPGHSEKDCWRGSAWEIHPVAEFFVCGKAGVCEPDGDGWVKLEDIEEP